MELALIDAIGPFFRGLNSRRINWSKIPFAHLQTSGTGTARQWEGIRADLESFAARVAGLGYTAVTLDDVAHLSDDPWLEPGIRERNGVFRREFRRLFEILRAANLRIFLTADFLTTSEAVDARIGRDVGAATEWFSGQLRAVLEEFPEVDGVILRIGESDGVDVEDPLRSRLLLHTAGQANAMLRALLPLFEERGKRLIFRTWTAGAYLIGDLIWHRGRLASALEGIDSPAFVLSMKYGESDFFRYLPLNRHFFRHDAPKIIELQARREYEGAGEYPSFVGWDCEHYARELEGARNVIGISVWCQTGGWHAFRRLAFLEPAAVWIDLNAVAAVRIFRDKRTVEQVVTEVFGADRGPKALEFLRLVDEVILQILYIEEFAQQKLFFRRVRIPPLLHVYWDSIFFNDAVRRTMAHFVRDPEAALRQGSTAFGRFERMIVLARELDLPVEDIEFMRDTFAMILLAREYYLLPFGEEQDARIRAAKKAYKARWPRSHRPRYRIRVNPEPTAFTRRTVTWLLRIFVRRQRGYRRVLDRIFALNVLSWTYRLFHARHRKAMPKFLRKTAMGVDSLFK